MVSAVYCGLTIRALARRRSEFIQMLAGCNNLNSSRYLRLMGLASVELMIGIPLSIYTLIVDDILPPKGTNVTPINPWISWENVHLNFGYVGQFPAFEWKVNHGVVRDLELTRWSLILCSFIFFGFFGFAQEARKNYRLAFNSVAKKVGYTTIGFNSGLSSSFGGSKQATTSITGRGTLPVYIRQETTFKRDSCASFSTNLTLGDVGGALDDVKQPFSPTESGSGSSRQSIDEKSMSPPYPPALTRPESTLDPTSHYIPDDESRVDRPDSNIV